MSITTETTRPNDADSLEPIQKYTKRGLLTKEWEYTLIHRVQNNNGSKKAQTELIKAYDFLIQKFARTYAQKSPHIDFNDLYQETVLGFMKAMQKFDSEKGFRLSTYAQFWMRAQLQEYTVKNNTVSSQPARMSDGWRKTIKDFYTELERLDEIYAGQIVPSEEYTAIEKKLGHSISEIQTFIASTSQVTQSLNVPLPGSEGDNAITGLDILVDEDAPSAFDLIDAQDRKEHLSAIFYNASLSPRDTDIVRLRIMGDQHGAPVTLDDLAEKYNVSRERIRQIEVASLDKLYKAARKIGHGKDLNDQIMTEKRPKLRHKKP